MPERRSPIVSTRKEPKQARSSELVASVLQAAAQVLAAEGAHRFTTGRVAEAAGVSVGSLYQYFPNKAAILFRLQSEEWRATAKLLTGILTEPSRPPLERLRRLIGAFVRSECEEAEMRRALSDAAPLYRDAPEAGAAREALLAVLTGFVSEAVPNAPGSAQAVAVELLGLTLSQVGKRFSETPRSTMEVEAFCEAMADMLCAYFERLEAPGGQEAAESRAPGPQIRTEPRPAAPPSRARHGSNAAPTRRRG